MNIRKAMKKMEDELKILAKVGFFIIENSSFDMFF